MAARVDSSLASVHTTCMYIIKVHMQLIMGIHIHVYILYIYTVISCIGSPIVHASQPYENIT